MNHIIILFNLNYDDTYSERYDALHEKINANAVGDVWKETTSSCIIQSRSSALSIDVSLSSVLSEKDKLVVIDVGNREKSTAGIKDSSLLTKNLGF